MGLGDRPFRTQEGHTFGKLVEDVEPFDGYVCSLDEFFPSKDLQEGRFSSCARWR